MIILNYESYVSLEVAILLEQAGFDAYSSRGVYIGDMFLDECYNRVTNATDDKKLHAPSLALAQRWLREVKGFEVFVGFTKHDFGGGNEKAYFYSCYEIPENEDAYEHYEDRYYHSYEEALEAGIKKALEIILEKGE